MAKIKIVILGLGGVGGYYGGMLARKYGDSDSVEISFIARGAHLEQIRRAGLRVMDENEDFTAFPRHVTDVPMQIGIADYLIVATKSYDLKAVVALAKPCIGADTIILPLLNGGDITEQLRALLPEHIVWSGCSYIVSRRISPGVIQSSGNISKLVFGYEKESNGRTEEFRNLLADAGIDVKLVDNVRDNIWQKFFFISVTASLTSYFNVGFNELAMGELRDMAVGMSGEFMAVAAAEGVRLLSDDVEQVVNRASQLPAGTTSSMHSDFLAGNPTEVETLTGAVVRFAHKNKIAVPLYEQVYEKLISDTAKVGKI